MAVVCSQSRQSAFLFFSNFSLTEVLPCFSSVVRQMPGLNAQSRGTDRISSELSFVLCLSLCYAIVFMLFCCYYVVLLLLLFVSSYVLIVCTVPLPPDINPIAIDKYIYLYLSN